MSVRFCGEKAAGNSSALVIAILLFWTSSVDALPTNVTFAGGSFLQSGPRRSFLQSGGPAGAYRVAPTTALLAVLEDLYDRDSGGDEAHVYEDQRLIVSALLFEGRTGKFLPENELNSKEWKKRAEPRKLDTFAEAYDYFVKRGRALLEEYVKANVGGGEASTVAVVPPTPKKPDLTEEQVTFILEEDQVRKFFESTFALHYVRDVVFADYDGEGRRDVPASEIFTGAGFAEWLESLENAIFDLTNEIPKLKIKMARQLKHADATSRRGLWQTYTEDTADLEWRTALAQVREHLPGHKRADLTPTAKGQQRLLRTFFSTRTVFTRGDFPLDGLYRSSKWFTPRARERRDMDEGTLMQTVAMGCQNFCAHASLLRATQNPEFDCCAAAINTFEWSLSESDRMKLPSCRDADLHRPIYVLEGRCAESDDMGARPLFVQQLFTRLVHTHTCSISGAANMLIGVLFEIFKGSWVGMDRLAVVGEPSEEKRHHYLQRLWYGFAAVVIAFLGGHSYSEMLIVPHIKEFGGEFGPDEAGVWPDLDNDNRCTSKSFVELLREMGAGLGERHTLDGVLRFLPGKAIPRNVVKQAMIFALAALPAQGGLGLDQPCDKPSKSAAAATERDMSECSTEREQICASVCYRIPGLLGLVLSAQRGTYIPPLVSYPTPIMEDMEMD